MITEIITMVVISALLIKLHDIFVKWNMGKFDKDMENFVRNMKASEEKRGKRG